MTKINLLPWREAQRHEIKRQFIAVSAYSAILTCLILVFVYWTISERVDVQASRNQVLLTEIASLDKEIKEILTLEKERSRLNARMKVVNKLELTRRDVVDLIYGLVATLPEGVFLTHVVQSAGGVTLTGMAQSNERVSQFMRELDDAKYFSNPRLSRISSSRVGAVSGSQFLLKVDQDVAK